VTIRAAQQHGQRPHPLDHAKRGELNAFTSLRISLDEEPRVYEMFKIQEDVCARAVFTP
jgi:hypothetical protein